MADSVQQKSNEPRDRSENGDEVAMGIRVLADDGTMVPLIEWAAKQEADEAARQEQVDAFIDKYGAYDNPKHDGEDEIEWVKREEKIKEYEGKDYLREKCLQKAYARLRERGIEWPTPQDPLDNL